MAGMVIAGGGQAAGQAVASLRQAGYKGAITLFGAETYPPYQRPPLSKQYLSGEYGLERVYLRPEKFYADRDVDLKLGVTVSGINPAAHTISTSEGNSMTGWHLLSADHCRCGRHTASHAISTKHMHYWRRLYWTGSGVDRRYCRSQRECP